MTGYWGLHIAIYGIQGNAATPAGERLTHTPNPEHPHGMHTVNATVATADASYRAAMDRIVQQVLALGEREIPSRQIGEMVMQELYKLDKVGYIRFASVYRSFQDVSDFRDALKEVEAPPPALKRARR